MKSIFIVLFASILLAFAARPAGGQIIVSDEVDGFFNHEGVDLNRDGTANLRFTWNYLGTMDYPSSGYTASLVVAPLAGSRIRTLESATPIGTGIYIGPGLSDSDWEARSMRTITSFHTPGGETWSGLIGDRGYGFVGFSFETASGTHYGWVRIQLEEALFGLGSSPYWPRIDSWAYQSQPDLAIAAGQIPEPSRIAALAGLAALVFVVMRRRKQFGLNGE